MNRRTLTDPSVNAPLFAVIGAQAVSWLSGSHPDSGTLRHVLVGVQAIR